MHIYHRIRDLREDADYTQQYVADQIGMWLNTYRNYETGKREPPLDFIISLAKLYDISIDYLAGLIDMPERLNRHRKK